MQTRTLAHSRSFDFNLARGMTAAEVAEVERLVNGWVAAAAPLETRVMDLAVRRGTGGRGEKGLWKGLWKGS